LDGWSADRCQSLSSSSLPARTDAVSTLSPVSLRKTALEFLHADCGEGYVRSHCAFLRWPEGYLLPPSDGHCWLAGWLAGWLADANSGVRACKETSPRQLAVYGLADSQRSPVCGAIEAVLETRVRSASAISLAVQSIQHGGAIASGEKQNQKPKKKRKERRESRVIRRETPGSGCSAVTVDRSARVSMATLVELWGWRLLWGALLTAWRLAELKMRRRTKKRPGGIYNHVNACVQYVAGTSSQQSETKKKKEHGGRHISRTDPQPSSAPPTLHDPVARIALRTAHRQAPASAHFPELGRSQSTQAGPLS